MKADKFFSTNICDRCGTDNMTVRTMSWFTKQAICMACSDKEHEIKKALRGQGIEDAMEGCGHVPYEVVNSIQPDKASQETPAIPVVQGSVETLTDILMGDENNTI